MHKSTPVDNFGMGEILSQNQKFHDFSQNPCPVSRLGCRWIHGWIEENCEKIRVPSRYLALELTFPHFKSINIPLILAFGAQNNRCRQFWDGGNFRCVFGLWMILLTRSQHSVSRVVSADWWRALHCSKTHRKFPPFKKLIEGSSCSFLVSPRCIKTTPKCGSDGSGPKYLIRCIKISKFSKIFEKSVQVANFIIGR